jgi:hypothetical protein
MLDTEQGPRVSSVADAAGLLVRRPEIELLFAEARRRRRRRRLLGVAASVVLAAAVVASVTIGGDGNGTAVRGGDGRRPAATTNGSSSRLALPSVRLAWVDNGDLVVGDPATGALRVGPPVDASLSAPLVLAAGHLYWADASTDGAPIRDYDLASGKIRYLPRGEAVFSSADGRSLYIARDARTLLVLRPDGSGPVAVHRTPAGWFMSGIGPGWVPTVGTSGVLVANSDTAGRGLREGVWNLATGQVRTLGAGSTIFGVYAPRRARYSLIAWAPPSRDFARDFARNYPLRITDTATGAMVTARSPLHFGFVAGGAPAFSPGGKQVAVFVRTAPLGSASGMSQLAIVDTGTGEVRLVPGTRLFTTEDAFWAMWLPGGQRILAGAVGSADLVDARTLAARPFTFFPNSTDGFSAVVLSGHR